MDPRSVVGRQVEHHRSHRGDGPGDPDQGADLVEVDRERAERIDDRASGLGDLRRRSQGRS